MDGRPGDRETEAIVVHPRHHHVLAPQDIPVQLLLTRRTSTYWKVYFFYDSYFVVPRTRAHGDTPQSAFVDNAPGQAKQRTWNCTTCSTPCSAIALSSPWPGLQMPTYSSME